MSAKSVAQRFRSLAAKARAQQAINRHEYIDLALEIGADAMEAVRVYVTNGEPTEYPAPERTNAVKAAEFAATLSLQAKPELEKPTAEEESKLAALGYKLVKVDETAPAGERVQ